MSVGRLLRIPKVASNRRGQAPQAHLGSLPVHSRISDLSRNPFRNPAFLLAAALSRLLLAPGGRCARPPIFARRLADARQPERPSRSGTATGRGADVAAWNGARITVVAEGTPPIPPGTSAPKERPSRSLRRVVLCPQAR